MDPRAIGPTRFIQLEFAKAVQQGTEESLTNFYKIHAPWVPEETVKQYVKESLEQRRKIDEKNKNEQIIQEEKIEKQM